MGMKKKLNVKKISETTSEVNYSMSNLRKNFFFFLNKIIVVSQKSLLYNSKRRQKRRNTPLIYAYKFQVRIRIIYKSRNI